MFSLHFSLSFFFTILIRVFIPYLALNASEFASLASAMEQSKRIKKPSVHTKIDGGKEPSGDTEPAVIILKKVPDKSSQADDVNYNRVSVSIPVTDPVTTTIPGAITTTSKNQIK